VLLLCVSFSFELEISVSANGRGLIALRVKTFLKAGEDVIGGNGDEDCFGLSFAARASQVCRTVSVYLSCFFPITFTAIDVGPGSTIDHCIGKLLRDFRLNRTGIRNIKCRVIVSLDPISARRTMFDQRASN